MDVSKIQQIIVTNRSQIPTIEIVERSFDFDGNVNYVLTGVRQAGKSYLLFQRIQSLLRAGTPIEQILYVNFDDERLLGFTTEDLDLILQAHYQMSEVKPILFSMSCRTLKVGKNSLAVLPMKNIVYLLREAMPKC